MKPSLSRVRHRALFKLLFAALVLPLALMWTQTTAQAGGNHQIFDLPGDFVLESGATLPNAKLSYVAHGTLNADRSNAIVAPSFYAGDHHGYDFLIGSGKALDPDRYFIIVTDMFGNGRSSSPSNTPPPLNGPRFPAISTRDNVKAAYRLVTEQLRLAVEELTPQLVGRNPSQPITPRRIFTRSCPKPPHPLFKPCRVG